MNVKRGKRQLFALLLALVMVLSLCPLTASAADALPELTAPDDAPTVIMPEASADAAAVPDAEMPDMTQENDLGPSTIAAKYSGNGIQGNGLDGIWINIYDAPYTVYAEVKEWGQYAYGPSGCAWFATSRATEKTGRYYGMIYSGLSWWNSKGAEFGYSRGSTIRANSLACYPHHIRYIESVSGNSIVVSEGGYGPASGNDYCILRRATIGDMATNTYLDESGWHTENLLGYVYLDESSGGSTPTASWDYVTCVPTDNDVKLKAKVTFDRHGWNSVVGVRIWDESGTLLKEHRENTDRNMGSNIIWYDSVRSECGIDLHPGVTYKYQFFNTLDGTVLEGPIESFTTTGTRPSGSWDYVTCEPTENDVKLKAKVSFDRHGWNSVVGVRIWDESGTLLKEYRENTDRNMGSNVIWYDSVRNECGVEFKAGTTYKYQFFNTLDGALLEGPVQSFTTAGAKPNPRPDPKPEPEPQPQLQHGWILDDYGWRYYGDNGKPVTDSWALDSQGWCYLGSDGYLKTNAWQLDSVGWCYLDGSGHVVTNSWKADSHGWVYLDGEGRMTRNAWVLDSQGWCYVGDDGYMVTNTWKMDSQGWCYLDDSGHIVTNSWKQDSHGWVYLDENGRMVYNCWQQDSSGWVWIGADGYAA